MPSLVTERSKRAKIDRKNPLILISPDDDHVIRPRDGFRPYRPSTARRKQTEEWHAKTETTRDGKLPRARRQRPIEMWINLWFTEFLAADRADGEKPAAFVMTRRQIRDALYERFKLWPCLDTITRWAARHVRAGLLVLDATFDHTERHGMAQRGNRYGMRIPRKVGQLEQTPGYVSPDEAEARAEARKGPEAACEVELIPATSTKLSPYKLEVITARLIHHRVLQERALKAEWLRRKQDADDAKAADMEQALWAEKAAKEAQATGEDLPDDANSLGSEPIELADVTPRHFVDPHLSEKQESKLDSWAERWLPAYLGANHPALQKERPLVEQLALHRELEKAKTRLDSTRGMGREPEESGQQQANLVAPKARWPVPKADSISAWVRHHTRRPRPRIS